MPADKDILHRTNENEVAQNVWGPLEKASWFRVAVREGFYVLPPQKPPHGEISQAFAELRTLVRYSEGVLNAFDERRRNDPSFAKREELVDSIKLSKLHQRGQRAMRHVEFLQELHSRVPLLDGDVDEFNVLSNQFKDQRRRFYEWCMLAASIEKGVLVPIHKTEDEDQRVESTRDKNSKEKFRATAIRFGARVAFALVIGFLIFKIRYQ